MTDTLEVAWLTEQFERNRPQLRALAYRLLGSFADAEDVVQETWVRLSRSDTDLSAIENIDAWLTTIAARICLDVIRARKSRREEPVGLRLPDPIVTWGERLDPEQQVLIGADVGLALLVVMQTLSPPERVAFVLHDMFDVPFDDIAALLGRTTLAVRQLASRARRRVQGSAIVPADSRAQRRAVEAYRAAIDSADFEALLAVLDPNVVLRSDRGSGVVELRGADVIGRRALAFAKLTERIQRVLVNGTDGLAAFRAGGEMLAVLSFTVLADRIVEIFVNADGDRLRGVVNADDALRAGAAASP